MHANVLVEVLGILGNLNLPDFGFERWVEKYELIHFLAEALQPEVVEDDILLEVSRKSIIKCHQTITKTNRSDRFLAECCYIHESKFFSGIKITFGYYRRLWCSCRSSATQGLQQRLSKLGLSPCLWSSLQQKSRTMSLFCRSPSCSSSFLRIRRPQPS